MFQDHYSSVLSWLVQVFKYGKKITFISNYISLENTSCTFVSQRFTSHHTLPHVGLGLCTVHGNLLVTVL